MRIEGASACVTADLAAGRVAGEAWPSAPEPDALERQWRAFCRAVLGRTAPENDARVGVAALELVERVHAAIASGAEGPLREDEPALGR